MFDRQAHWEKIYSEKKPEEVSWFQEDPEKSVELILAAGLPPDANIIDVGGGASRLVDRLLALGFSNLTVLDISEKALGYAKERLGFKAEKVRWIVGDVTIFVPDHPYDLWHDRAVFHFLTEKADREKYVSRIHRYLKPRGRLILAAFAKDGPDRCSNLPVRQYDAALVKAEFGESFELVKESAESHHTPWGKEQKFGFFLLRRRDNVQ